MSQSEIAGSPMTLAGEKPAKGHRFPDLELTTASGQQVHLSDYRGRSNLVLVFTDNKKEAGELLSEMAESYAQFRVQETEIIAVAECPRQECAQIEERLKLPFSVLADADGSIHRVVGASDLRGQPATAVYVTDRYGEVFALYRTSEGQPLPRAAEILGWLEFINLQCPECEAPEWPA